jgi:uncharacterized RDD family membrane protein YckC
MQKYNLASYIGSKVMTSEGGTLLLLYNIPIILPNLLNSAYTSGLRIISFGVVGEEGFPLGSTTTIAVRLGCMLKTFM